MRYKNFKELEKTFRQHENSLKNNGTPISWYQYKAAKGLECEHKDRRAMRWQMSNGVWRAGLFCKACGHKYTNGVKNDDYVVSRLPEDDQLWEKYLELDREISGNVSRASRTKSYMEWKGRAAEYYTSAEWGVTKGMVFRRDGYICQACLAAQAAEVHHTTYDYPYGHEPLYTLQSVCRPCHERITKMDRDRRGEGWLAELDY